MATQIPPTVVAPKAVAKKRGALSPTRQRQLFWDRVNLPPTLAPDAPPREHFYSATPKSVGINLDREHYFVVDPFHAFQQQLERYNGHVFSKDAPVPWPTSTQLHCWNDGFSFTGIPFMSPLHYHDETYSFSGCVGVFCSPGCVLRWIQNTCHAQAQHRAMVFYIFLERVFNITECYEAPPTSMLQHFGGDMTLEAYRKASQVASDGDPPEFEFQTCLPTFVPETMLIRIIQRKAKTKAVTAIQV